MRRGRPKSPLTLTTEEYETLERWARRPTTAQALAQRARIVLACTTGKPDTVVAMDARVTRLTVGRWRRRFIAQRLAGLLDEPRPGAPRKITDKDVERVIALTLESIPQGRNALEHARNGQTQRTKPNCRIGDLACLCAATASHRDFQIIERSSVRR